MNRLLARLAASSVIALSATRTAAGQSSELPDAPSLRTPASPAFILLGVSPTDVYKPKSVADFAATAVSGSRDFSTIPQNLAIETSPYWLRPRPALTWKADTARTIGQSVARTLALSFATTNLGTEDAPATGVGAGIRFSLLSGRLSDSSQRWLRRVEQNATQQGAIFLAEKQRRQKTIDRELEATLRRIDTLHAGDPARRDLERRAAVASYAVLNAGINAEIEADPAYQERIAAERAKITDIALAREGFIWDVAGGATWQFAGESWESGELAKHGIWTTMTYEGAEFGRWSPILAVRYLRDASGDEDDDAVDIGGRILRTADRFGVSVEYVHRRLTGEVADTVKRSQYRLTGMLEYRLAADTWVIASFGRAYDDEPRRGNLVAQLGITAAFSRDRYKPE